MLAPTALHGPVPKWLKGGVCKTLIQQFESAQDLMKNKTELSVFTIGSFAFAILYSLLLFGKLNVVPGYFTPNQIVISDTILTPVAKQGLDTIVDVNGKNALFIGDSHTANHDWGWQVIVCKKTGLRMNNTAVIGKHLPWMVNIAKTSITSNFDYCFIYGGANDIHGNRNPYQVVKDVQKIVDICNSKGVKPVVLTGFNAEECVRPIKGQEFYPKAYTRYQRILMDSVKNATVIDTRVVVRTDCGDWTCHMHPSGHKKVAERVIKSMKLKILD
jgi:hypothetical protein